jgi:hypothetical protein
MQNQLTIICQVSHYSGWIRWLNNAYYNYTQYLLYSCQHNTISSRWSYCLQQHVSACMCHHQVLYRKLDYPVRQTIFLSTHTISSRWSYCLQQHVSACVCHLQVHYRKLDYPVRKTMKPTKPPPTLYKQQCQQELSPSHPRNNSRIKKCVQWTYECVQYPIFM